MADAASQPGRNIDSAIGYTDAAAHISQVGLVLGRDNSYSAAASVYTWHDSAAGRSVSCSVPKGLGPHEVTVSGLSRRAARAFSPHGLDWTVDSTITLTLNAPESGLPAVLARAGQRELGVMAVDQLMAALNMAGFVDAPSLPQRAGRFFLAAIERFFTPLMYENSGPPTREPL